MKLITLIETMEAKQADMLKELKDVLTLHGDGDAYRGDNRPTQDNNRLLRIYLVLASVSD